MSYTGSSATFLEQTYKTTEGIIVKVYNGNILSLKVDCIVNAANSQLSHGGGVAEVISRATIAHMDICKLICIIMINLNLY
jgi:hypothetical protein